MIIKSKFSQEQPIFYASGKNYSNTILSSDADLSRSLLISIMSSSGWGDVAGCMDWRGDVEQGGRKREAVLGGWREVPLSPGWRDVPLSRRLEFPLL